MLDIYVGKPLIILYQVLKHSFVTVTVLEKTELQVVNAPKFFRRADPCELSYPTISTVLLISEKAHFIGTIQD
jgi:hypothetical protein